MFALGLYDQMTRNESTPARKRRDHNDECHDLQCLQRCIALSTDPSIDALHNTATMDQATEDFQESLQNADSLGQKQVNGFVKERFMLSNYGSLHRKSCDSLKKTKAPFASRYVVKIKTNKRQGSHN